jgi:hypothetical protein
MKSKQKYITPKIEMLLIVLENCFDRIIDIHHNKDIGDKKTINPKNQHYDFKK